MTWRPGHSNFRVEQSSFLQFSTSSRCSQNYFWIRCLRSVSFLKFLTKFFKTLLAVRSRKWQFVKSVSLLNLRSFIKSCHWLLSLLSDEIALISDTQSHSLLMATPSRWWLTVATIKPSLAMDKIALTVAIPSHRSLGPVSNFMINVWIYTLRKYHIQIFGSFWRKPGYLPVQQHHFLSLVCKQVHNLSIHLLQLVTNLLAERSKWDCSGSRLFVPKTLKNLKVVSG